MENKMAYTVSPTPDEREKISSRVKSIRFCVLTNVDAQGQITEVGDHEALLAQGGHYAELYTTYFRHQSSAYQPWVTGCCSTPAR